MYDELTAAMEIRDHYPKYVVTLNEMDTGIENSIRAHTTAVCRRMHLP